MLALALAATLSVADLQQWMDDQPEVRAYEMRRTALRPPAEDAFRAVPPLPRRAACSTAAAAMQAAVSLFKVSDQPQIALVEPDLVARNDGQPMLKLGDGGKQALVERARGYEADAGRYEPSCLG